MSELSTTIRDYLAKIYSLSEFTGHHAYVSTSALADTMMVSAPAVNRMVTKLKEMGLLLHEPYQGIALTGEGKRRALMTLRYQRIAATFLVNMMGFGWHEIGEESERMSAALSEPLAMRMLAMAGNPTTDPYGEPLPALDGSVHEPDDMNLSDADAEKIYRVTRVKSREPDRLEYIAALGLMPGVEVELIHKAPFNGPMQLKMSAEFRIIGHNLAELIRVQPS